MEKITNKEWEGYLKIRKILINLDIDVNDQDGAGVELGYFNGHKGAWRSKRQTLNALNNAIEQEVKTGNCDLAELLEG